MTRRDRTIGRRRPEARFAPDDRRPAATFMCSPPRADGMVWPRSSHCSTRTAVPISWRFPRISRSAPSSTGSGTAGRSSHRRRADAAPGDETRSSTGASCASRWHGAPRREWALARRPARVRRTDVPPAHAPPPPPRAARARAHRRRSVAAGAPTTPATDRRTGPPRWASSGRTGAHRARARNRALKGEANGRVRRSSSTAPAPDGGTRANPYGAAERSPRAGCVRKTMSHHGALTPKPRS